MSEHVAIDNVAAPGGGRIGMIHCPGTGALGTTPGDPMALIEVDLQGFCTWGANAVVTLLEPFEMRLLRVDGLGERAGDFGLQWWHLSITDGCAPGQDFEQRWREAGAALHAILDRSGRVVLHCRAGLGRSGTVAALLLIERGFSADRAIAAVRRARPGAIENIEQAAWLRTLATR